jgi:hypothetical protein
MSANTGNWRTIRTTKFPLMVYKLFVSHLHPAARQFAGVHTLLRIILSSNSAVLINIITGVSPPHFDFFVFYVLCQC